MSFTMCLKEVCNRFSLNLHAGTPTVDSDIAFHFNPRLDRQQTVMNARFAGAWNEVEEKVPLAVSHEDGSASKVFVPNRVVQIVVKGETKYYQARLPGVT